MAETEIPTTTADARALYTTLSAQIDQRVAVAGAFAASLVERDKQIAQERVALLAALGKGVSTGDPIVDVLIRAGTLPNKIVEDGLRELREKLKGKRGQLLLIGWSVYHPVIGAYDLPEVRPLFRVGLLEDEKLIFMEVGPGHQILTVPVSRYVGGAVQDTFLTTKVGNIFEISAHRGVDAPSIVHDLLERASVKGDPTSPQQDPPQTRSYNLEIVVGDEAVKACFAEVPELYERMCEKLRVKVEAESV